MAPSSKKQKWRHLDLSATEKYIDEAPLRQRVEQLEASGTLFQIDTTGCEPLKNLTQGARRLLKRTAMGLSETKNEEDQSVSLEEGTAGAQVKKKKEEKEEKEERKTLCLLPKKSLLQVISAEHRKQLRKIINKKQQQERERKKDTLVPAQRLKQQSGTSMLQTSSTSEGRGNSGLLLEDLWPAEDVSVFSAHSKQSRRAWEKNNEKDKNEDLLEEKEKEEEESNSNNASGGNCNICDGAVTQQQADDTSTVSSPNQQPHGKTAPSPSPPPSSQQQQQADETTGPKKKGNEKGGDNITLGAKTQAIENIKKKRSRHPHQHDDSSNTGDASYNNNSPMSDIVSSSSGRKEPLRKKTRFNTRGFDRLRPYIPAVRLPGDSESYNPSTEATVCGMLAAAVRTLEEQREMQKLQCCNTRRTYITQEAQQQKNREKLEQLLLANMQQQDIDQQRFVRRSRLLGLADEADVFRQYYYNNSNSNYQQETHNEEGGGQTKNETLTPDKDNNHPRKEKKHTQTKQHHPQQQEENEKKEKEKEEKEEEKKHFRIQHIDDVLSKVLPREDVTCLTDTQKQRLLLDLVYKGKASLPLKNRHTEAELYLEQTSTTTTPTGTGTLQQQQPQQQLQQQEQQQQESKERQQQQDNAVILRAKRREKKTRTERNRRLRFLQQQRRHAAKKAARRWRETVNRMDILLKEIDDDAHERSLKKQQREANLRAKILAAKQGLVKLKIGRNRHIEPPPAVQLPEDLTGSLRTAKPAAAASGVLCEYFASLRRRGLIELPFMGGATGAALRHAQRQCARSRASRKLRRRKD